MEVEKPKRQKAGGRKAGTPNKVTTDLRERIKHLIEKNFERIESDFNKLDSEKRLIVLERYLKYTLPPLQSLDISDLPKVLAPPTPRIYICADQETKDVIEELSRQVEENQ